MAEQQNKDPKIELKEWDRTNMIEGQLNIPNIYINNVHLGFSNWDMYLVLGEMLGERDKNLVVTPKVRVTMSLQFAKAFADLLKTNLDAFESEAGEINLISFMPQDKNTELEKPTKKK